MAVPPLEIRRFCSRNRVHFWQSGNEPLQTLPDPESCQPRTRSRPDDKRKMISRSISHQVTHMRVQMVPIHHLLPHATCRCGHPS